MTDAAPKTAAPRRRKTSPISSAAVEELGRIKPQTARLPEMAAELEQLDEDSQRSEQRARSRKEYCRHSGASRILKARSRTIWRRWTEIGTRSCQASTISSIWTEWNYSPRPSLYWGRQQVELRADGGPPRGVAEVKRKIMRPIGSPRSPSRGRRVVSGGAARSRRAGGESRGPLRRREPGAGGAGAARRGGQAAGARGASQGKGQRRRAGGQERG